MHDETIWIHKSDVAVVKFFDVIQLTTRRCRRLNKNSQLFFFFQQLEIIDEFRLRLHQVSDVDTISHER